MYGLSIGDKSGDLGWTLAYFPGATYSTTVSRTLFVGARRNLAALGDWSIETYSPNFVNFGRWSCDNIRRHAWSVLHWYTYTLVFRQFPVFIDSFSVVSIHCVARNWRRAVLSADAGLLIVNIAAYLAGCKNTLQWSEWHSLPTRVLCSHSINCK